MSLQSNAVSFLVYLWAYLTRWGSLPLAIAQLQIEDLIIIQMIFFSEHTQLLFTHPVKVSPSACSGDSFQYLFVSGVPQTTFRLDNSLEVPAILSQRACIAAFLPEC